MIASIEERFWSKVRKTDDCWTWIGATVPKGYGKLYRERRVEYAHRISWLLHHGPVPDGLWVLHRCDNPACVNPAHLFLGTVTDNNRDMYAKGRGTRYHAEQTACLRGHPFTAENTYPYRGGRLCRECRRIECATNDQKRRRRAGAKPFRFVSVPPLTDSETTRFWAKVEKSGECWLWTASLRTSGAGQFMVASVRRPFGAPRIAWTLTNGAVPLGYVLRRTCSESRCLRPGHFRLQSWQDQGT